MKKIWDKWVEEYLPQLAKKKKWTSEEKGPMALGELVWVCDRKYQPFNYPMGRILELHTSEDDQSRSATKKTSRGQIRKPLVSWDPLEIDRNDVFLATKKGASDVAVKD